jgi:hypothetical protein
MTDNPCHSPSGLYAFTECEVVNMRNGAVMLIDKFGDGQLLVAPPVAQGMQMCRAFRTLEEHVQVLTSSIPELAGQHEDVMSVLNMLKDGGLLVTAESVCERLNDQVDAPVDLPPTRVFIITCDRPAAVERLLESMLHAGGMTRHEAMFLVDDSRDTSNTDRNRDAVERFNLTSPRNMQYVGAAEQAVLMDKLISELPGQERGIRFLMDREQWVGEKTYGLARNLCLLLSVGRRAIVMDDDVICAAVPSPRKQEGLQFGECPREVEFYSSEQDILSQTSRADFDPLNGHASCLGLNIGQAMKKVRGGAITTEDLKNADSGYLSQWTATSQVIVTQCGTIGDPGTPSSQWIYTLDANAFQRMAQRPGGMEAALTNRHYWRGQARPMFTKMSVISQVIGLDNSELLPPYFPVFRGEDYLFGAMTEFLNPQSAVLEYDWSIPHFPLDARPGKPTLSPINGKGLINPSKYVTDHTNYQTGISAETRLQVLSGMTRSLSTTDDHGLATIYRTEVAEAQGRELAWLKRLAQNGSTRPPAWQEWVSESIQLISDSMQTHSRVEDMHSLPPQYTQESALNKFRELSQGFADSLDSWLQIRASAAAAFDDFLAQLESGRLL